MGESSRQRRLHALRRTQTERLAHNRYQPRPRCVQDGQLHAERGSGRFLSRGGSTPQFLLAGPPTRLPLLGGSVRMT
jgi:hypothetical protein